MCGAVLGIDCSVQEGRHVLVDPRLIGKRHSWMGWDGCGVQMGSMHGGTEGPRDLLYSSYIDFCVSIGITLLRRAGRTWYVCVSVCVPGQGL